MGTDRLKIKEFPRVMNLKCVAIGKHFEFDTPFHSKIIVEKRVIGVVQILRMGLLRRLEHFTITGDGVNVCAILTNDEYSIALVIGPREGCAPFDLQDLRGCCETILPA